ncbi:phage tail protein [Cytobacillus sp. IB215316]|uniref:phage tail protein n=1 Tax=Cytobacillus sp. IB215316 TaxID=3097354 RepID=UPI002A0CB6AD|nr:phage tail protein [Cytobacillus sp. IB215316]MDX8359831.1 phage tail protein [Cytobacillus sp. IB215316]
MTIKSGIFNSVNGDRRYKAEDFAAYFATFIKDGVFPNPSNGFQVIANGDMTVSLKAGQAWIKGYYITNDSDYNITLDVADGVLNRIDRIGLRLDFLNREILPVVMKGEFASSPVVPALQRDADAYEIALADVLVNNGALSISQSNISDQRFNTDLCGIVAGAVDQIDTTNLFAQYDDEFKAWFETIRDTLSGDVAGNLSNLITSISEDVSEHKAEDATTSRKGHVQLSSSTSSTSEMLAATPKAVKAAMDKANEAFTQVSDGKITIATAITDVDSSLSPTGSDTFDQLANTIRMINTGKKWAIGTATYSNGAVTARGLDFRPNYIMVVLATSYIITHYPNWPTNDFRIDGSGNVAYTSSAWAIFNDGFSVKASWIGTGQFIAFE